MMFTLEQLREAAQRAGFDAAAVESLIAALPAAQSPRKVLTVICNEGIHPMPREQFPGRVIAATQGSLPDHNVETLADAVTQACREVALTIKREGPFAEIYLVPSGYGVVLQKLAEMIVQVTGRPAATLHFDNRTQAYWTMQLNLREIAAEGLK